MKNRIIKRQLKGKVFIITEKEKMLEGNKKLWSSQKNLININLFYNSLMVIF